MAAVGEHDTMCASVQCFPRRMHVMLKLSTSDRSMEAIRQIIREALAEACTEAYAGMVYAHLQASRETKRCRAQQEK